MKKIQHFTLIIFGVFSLVLYSPIQASEEITFFSGSWEEALSLAKKNQQTIFVDAYATWCGPCKYMDKNVFNNAEVAAYYNQHFINYKLDVDKESGIAQYYSVEVMPTYIFVNPEGQAIYRKTGAMDSKAFLTIGRNALKVPALEKKFAEGNREPAFIQDYLLAHTDEPNEKIRGIAREYFAKVKLEDLLAPKNFELMSHFTNDAESREFKFYLENLDRYVDKYPGEASSIAFNAIDQIYTAAIEEESLSRMEDLKNLLAKMPSIIEAKDAQNMYSLARLSYFEELELWSQYAEAAQAHFQNFGKEDIDILMQTTYNFSLHVEDVKALEKADQWMKELNEGEESFAPLYLEALILKKLSRKDEALQAAKKSLELAKEEEIEVSMIEELIDSLKSMD